MAEQYSPNKNFSYGWDLGEDNWKLGMDNNMLKLDCFLFCLVLDKDLTTPPGGESEGDTYIVGSAPTGAWAGHANDIAFYVGGAYRFYTPTQGWTVSVVDEAGGVYYFNGTAWVGGMVIPDGGNTTLGTVTGTQFGTSQLQKLAFFGETPVIRPSSADQVSVTPTNTDGDVGGLTISAAYSQSEVQALRDACEVVADDMRANNVLLSEIRDSLVALGLIKGSI